MIKSRQCWICGRPVLEGFNNCRQFGCIEICVRERAESRAEVERLREQLRLANIDACNLLSVNAALTVVTAEELARRMAGMTRIIRDLIYASLKHEEEKADQAKLGVVNESMPGYGPPSSWLHIWLAAFRKALIPDLSEAEFGDMFAQTLSYGLFAARVHMPDNKEFSREMAAFSLPKTNPFLRKLFSEFAGVSMPGEIAWAVDDVVQLLKHVDMGKILEKFGKGTAKEDPVTHFYETFLAAYDPKMRDERGVRYTPVPVVGYIVKSIDYLLRTRFNRPKGLADENTLILDPATGTATFHYFVILLIYEQFAKQKGVWNDYVEKHLLNRLFGFELLMAPYAIAHLKLGMLLEETGYKFETDQRLGIYLTNTLEEAAKKGERVFEEWGADEANAAAKIKRDAPILVVLGNPPYSGHSANRSRDAEGKLTFIGGLIEDYRQVDGQPLGERNPKWLQDDYVKFIRFAEWRIAKTGEGIVGYITNHSYLDNPTFRGMRRHLMSTFNELWVYDLHGNSKKKEKCPDGSKDENVFDIQQGVAIMLCVKQKDNSDVARVNHADVWGQREHKYACLAATDMSQTEWTELRPTSPAYLFVPQDTRLSVEYEQGWKATEVFPINSVGVVTARDAFTIDFGVDPLKGRIRAFADEKMSDEQIDHAYGLHDKPNWKLQTARQNVRKDEKRDEAFTQILYRPFDFRWIFYHDAVIERSRREVMQHMMRENLALVAPRQTHGNFRHVFVADKMVEFNLTGTAGRYGSGYLFPLYLYPARGEQLTLHEDGRPNLSPGFLKALAEKLNLSQEGSYGLPKGIAPEDIFHYAYAVFHSPTYRTRYAEFLKIDFPRLPLTSDAKLFRALAEKGAELVALHLMESPKLNNFITEFSEKGDNVVEKVEYTDKNQRVGINKTQYFGGVPKEVWDFHIGGYPVCQKWLKDRKGRTLTYDDIVHYQKIVVAINETSRLMAEIDECIPGWPLA